MPATRLSRRALHLLAPRLTAAVLVSLATLPGLAAAQTATPAPAAQGVPVQAAAVTARDVPVVLQAIGTVQAFKTVTVRARVDGTLDTVAFTEGQHVNEGDVLAQIDPRPYQATLDQALAKKAADQAQMANARLDLSRYSDLAKSQFASRQSVDTQTALVQQFQATLLGDDATIEAARLNLSFTRITTPIKGRVGFRIVDPGNLVHANDAGGIVTVTQLQPISAIFTLPQDDLPRVHEAMATGKLPVAAFNSTDTAQLSGGELLTVNNTIDQTTGTIQLKATFANTDEKLWPGQFINAHLTLSTLKGALTIPTAAIQHGPNGLFVYLIKPDNTVAVAPVKLTQDDGALVVIASGLKAGDNVVVNGQSRLQAGTHVTVIPVSAS